MPRGVYDRTKKGRWANASADDVIDDTRAASIGLSTAVVDKLPELQQANANVEPILQTHGDDTISTTERLFGDLNEKEKPVVQDPESEPEPISENNQPEPQANQKTEEPKAEPVNSTPKGEDEFIDWDKLASKKIRQKVDGKEVIVTAEDLKKYSDQDQIKRHLADAADRVGEERRKLAEERKQLMELRQQRQNQYEAPIQNGMPQGQQPGFQQQPSPQPDYSNPVFQRIQQLEAQIQQMANSTAPAIFQSNRMALDNSLRARGFNDFNDYWPKIQTMVSPQLIQELNGNEMRAAELTYFQLKAQEMEAARNKPQNQTVPRATSAPQPIPATQIDGGASASVPVNDDGTQRYRAAFRRAVSLGDDREAWNEVLRQKRPDLFQD